MRTFRKLGIATIACAALSGAAWAHPGNGNGGGNGNGNSGRGNDALRSVISVPQITTPLIHRSGNQVLSPIVNHKLPSNSMTDGPGNRGIGLRGPDLKTDHGRHNGRDLDRKQVTTKIDEKSEKTEKTDRAEKVEKEIETRLAANTVDDTSRKTDMNQPQVSCR